MDEHAQAVVRRVRKALEATASGEIGPTVLLAAARAGEAALDNANADWKRLLFELSLAVDSALNPWPRRDWFDERAAVMQAGAVRRFAEATDSL